MNISSTSAAGAMSFYSAAVNTTEADSERNASRASSKTSATAGQDDAADSVSISGAAARLSHNNSTYSPYFPVRPGMDADALVNGVSNPGAVSSSQGKSFPDVAADARKRMDEKYAAMNAGGQPFDKDSREDTNSLLGDLDRRSLYAVSSNEGGLFTQEEQDAATNALRQQESLATGFYSGPADQEKNFVDPFDGDLLGRIKAGIAFLDNVSGEEKSSSGWMKQRAQLETSLQTELGLEASTAKKPTENRHYILAELMAQWSAGDPTTEDTGGKASIYQNMIDKFSKPSADAPDSSAPNPAPEKPE